MYIFKDGYLLPEYINPNYRGLVGWKCKLYEDNFSGDISPIKIHAIANENIFYTEVSTNIPRCEFLENMIDAEDPTFGIKIPQFTPADIPVGELCWVESEFYGFQLKRFKKTMLKSLSNKKGVIYSITPYLIAETPEQAEELRDWSNYE